MRDTARLDRRIFEKHNGCYCVLFTNHNLLDLDEIGNVFSQFGEYLEIRPASTERGCIHFVTYATYEEAKNAVNELMEHPDIRLKVYRNKKNNVDQRMRISRHYYNDNGYNNYYNNRRTNGGYTDRRAYRGEFFDDRNNARDAGYVDSSEEEKFIVNENNNNGERSVQCSETSMSEAVDAESDRCETNEKSSSWHNVQNYIESCNNAHPTEHHRQSDESIETIATTISMEIEKNPSSSDEMMTVDSIKTTTDDNDEESRPMRQEIVVEKAAEIVVGNVDLRTSEAYLLHLFNKYEPIAISRLVPMPDGKARYCCVYFKSTEEAERVERLFDKLCLAGRQLVVQRPRRLVALYLQHI